MRKITKLKLGLFILAMFLLLIPTKVKAEQSGVWKYSVDSGEATLEEYYGGNVVNIPSSIDGYPVTKLGWELFLDSNITSVTIPARIEKIDYKAFAGCKYLSTINYNAKEAKVDKYIFANAGKFSGGITVNFGASVERIPSLFSNNSDEYAHVIKVVMSNNVKYIDDAAFNNCIDLESINLSSNLLEIGWEAFRNCLSLKTITIPSKVEYIGHRAFQDCKYLSTINYNAKEAKSEGNSTFVNAGKFAGKLDVVIGEGVKKIPSSLFNSGDSYPNYPYVTSVKIASSVTEIENYAFDGCYALKTVTMYSRNCSYPDWSSKQPFSNCPSTMTFKCYRGSTTAAFAKKKGFKISYIDPEPPKTVSLTSIKTGKQSIQASWSKISNASGYEIQIATDTKFAHNRKAVTIGNQSTTSTNFSNLKVGQKYYIHARSYKNYTLGGKTAKSYSGWCSVKTIYTKPNTPTLKSVSGSKKALKATWSKMASATGYQVQVATNSKFTSNKKTVTISKQSTTSTTVKSLKAKKKYYVRIRSYKGNKTNCSSWSNVKSVTTK